MSIQFLSPNPEQKEALDELEKLLEVLERKPSRRQKNNIRFVKSFTQALLVAGKNRSSSSVKTKKFQKSVEIEVKPAEEKIIEEKKPLPKIIPVPPPPPPRPMPSSPQLGVNIKGGGKSFESFVQNVYKENGVLRFNIIEPEMEPLDWRIFNEVKPKLKQQIIKEPSVLERENFLTDEIKNACTKLKIKYSDSYLRKIKYYLVKYIKGFGKMDPLIKDSDVAEILCNSYNNIKVKYKNEFIPTNIQFDTNEELDNFILNIAEKSNQKVSEANPELIASLQGLRVSAFYNPIMGSRFTIVKQ